MTELQQREVNAQKERQSPEVDLMIFLQGVGTIVEGIGFLQQGFAVIGRACQGVCEPARTNFR